MSNKTLTISRPDLLKAIGRFLGWNRDTTKWSPSQNEDSEAILDKGLRQFYQPPLLPGERTTHEWSFLKPLGSLTTVQGVGDYDLPEDFAGICGPLTYASEDCAPGTIIVTNEARIRELRQRYTAVTGYPTQAAIVPLQSNGEQRFSLMLDPIPHAPYTLQYRYQSNPYKITGQQPYPLGGQPHSETLRASVLAAAELEMNDAKELRWQDFVEKLQSSVAHDRRFAGPHNFGYNGDPGMNQHPSVIERSRYVTFEGNRY